MHILFAMLRQLRDRRGAPGPMLEAGASTQRDRVGAAACRRGSRKQIAAQAEQADGERLERALDELAELDYAVRGGGNVDTGTALTLTLAARLERSKGRARPSRRGADARGAGLLARGVVAVNRAVLGGLVDQRDELAVLGVDRLAVAGLDRGSGGGNGS